MSKTTSVGKSECGRVHCPVNHPLVVGPPSPEPDDTGVDVRCHLLVYHVLVQSLLCQLEEGDVPPRGLHRLATKWGPLVSV